MGLTASRAWKNTSGFCAVPRMLGASGVNPARYRCSATNSSLIIARITVSSLSNSILEISCEVRKPSKKCRKGNARFEGGGMGNQRHVVTFLDRSRRRVTQNLSGAPPSRPSGHRKWIRLAPLSDRAAIWKTVGVSSPAILYIFGSINNNPCEAVKVVVNEPTCNAPCTAPSRATFGLHFDHRGHCPP